MGENSKNQQENNWKHQELMWRLHLNKVSDLDVHELKLLNLLDVLSDHTNCVNLESSEDHQSDNLRKAIKGLRSEHDQNKTLKKLWDKNMVIPNTGDNINQIIKTVCAHCRLDHYSKECMLRRGTHYLNKNNKTWKTTPKTTFNEPQMEKMLKLNQIAVPDNQPVKPQINRHLKSLEEKPNKPEKKSSFMSDFKAFAKSLDQ